MRAFLLAAATAATAAAGCSNNTSPPATTSSSVAADDTISRLEAIGKKFEEAKYTSPEAFIWTRGEITVEITISGSDDVQVKATFDRKDGKVTCVVNPIQRTNYVTPIDNLNLKTTEELMGRCG